MYVRTLCKDFLLLSLPCHQVCTLQFCESALTVQFGCKVLISEQNDGFSTIEKGMQALQMNSRIAELTVIWLALFSGLKFSFVCLAGFVEVSNSFAFRFDDLAVFINSMYCTTLRGCFF